MANVGIRQLKNETSSVIDRVERGEIVTVTRRGRPVARMVSPNLPHGMAQLVQDGIVSWNGRSMKLPDHPPQLIGAGPSAADYVSEGRR